MSRSVSGHNALHPQYQSSFIVQSERERDVPLDVILATAGWVIVGKVTINCYASVTRGGGWLAFADSLVWELMPHPLSCHTWIFCHVSIVSFTFSLLFLRQMNLMCRTSYSVRKNHKYTINHNVTTANTFWESTSWHHTNRVTTEKARSFCFLC